MNALVFNCYFMPIFLVIGDPCDASLQDARDLLQTLITNLAKKGWIVDSMKSLLLGADTVRRFSVGHRSKTPMSFSIRADILMDLFVNVTANARVVYLTRIDWDDEGRVSLSGWFLE